MPSRIEDYALVGDCETAALIGRDGSVDWLCWPRFDSDACFAALLGSRDNGRWLLRPMQDAARVSRRYRPGTLILETRFETEEGAASVIDFMPVRRDHSHLVRIVRGERGRVAMRFELVLRFDYGSIVPWVTRLEARTLRAIAGPDMVLLRSAVDVRGEDFMTVAGVTVGDDRNGDGVVHHLGRRHGLGHRHQAGIGDAAARADLEAARPHALEAGLLDETRGERVVRAGENDRRRGGEQTSERGAFRWMHGGIATISHGVEAQTVR